MPKCTYIDNDGQQHRISRIYATNDLSASASIDIVKLLERYVDDQHKARFTEKTLFEGAQHNG